jgi:amino-acid N-acetyltransferase
MTSADATLRPARPDDLPAIVELLTNAGLPLEGVADALQGFVVAESENALVGVAGLEVRSKCALLRSVAVAPAWRSRGVGGALVRRLIADAEGRGLRALYLLTTTAERYFPAFGFRDISRDEVAPEIKETEEFASACPATAVAMFVELGAPRSGGSIQQGHRKGN